MSSLTRIEILGPFVRGKRRGETLTVPTGSPEEREWKATGQVRAVVLQGRGPSEPVIAPKRGEIVALEAADLLDGLAKKAEAHGPQAVEAVRLKLRTHPKALDALLVLLGLSVGLSEGSPVEPSPEERQVAEATAQALQVLAEARQLLGLDADAATDAILDAIEDLRAGGLDRELAVDAGLAQVRQVLGLAVDASIEAVLDGIQDLHADAARPPAEPSGDAPASSGAILLAELLGTPDAFTVSGIRLVAAKNGIDLPATGGKAELLEVVRLAVAGAASAPPTDTPPPPSGGGFLDELDRQA